MSRLSDKEYDGDEHEYTDEERRSLIFINNRIYRHKVLRVNHTTYDLRRSQDSLNARTHADIMVAAQEDQSQRNSHPYWYARIVGVFHADVQHVGPSSSNLEPGRMEFLWVRWFGRDMTTRSGWRSRRLPRVGFVGRNANEDGHQNQEEEDSPAFGFLDPAQVIRGVHLIPAFACGRTSGYLGPSIARSLSENDEDWMFYYVNMYVLTCILVLQLLMHYHVSFVDRDMFMRYLGGGVGHRAVLRVGPAVESNGTEAEVIDEDLSDSVQEVAPIVIPEETDAADDGEENEEEEGGEEEEGEEDDYGYQSGDTEGEQDNGAGENEPGDVEEEDFGPEDGEDDVGEGDELEDAEGYAPL